MKHFSRLAIITATTFLSLPLANATAVPNTDHPTSALGPTMRLGLTGLLTDTSGYSFAGELSPFNFRASATYGWNIFTNHNLKLTGELLEQRITYGYFAGNVHHYETQGAIGADYLYDINRASIYRPEFDLHAYYSYSGADSLGTTGGTFTNLAGLPQNYIDTQRASGANATGVSPGVALRLWQGSRMGLAFNYDRVRYDMKYQVSNTVSGAGATWQLNQMFTESFGFDAAVGIRKPFNYYQANVGWDKLPHYTDWALKLGASYVSGKSGLPNTYNLMLALDYFLDRNCSATDADRMKNEWMGWVAKPAVYMPQVLSVADESVVLN